MACCGECGRRSSAHRMPGWGLALSPSHSIRRLRYSVGKRFRTERSWTKSAWCKYSLSMPKQESSNRNSLRRARTSASQRPETVCKYSARKLSVGKQHSCTPARLRFVHSRSVSSAPGPSSDPASCRRLRALALRRGLTTRHNGGHEISPTPIESARLATAPVSPCAARRSTNSAECIAG